MNELVNVVHCRLGLHSTGNLSLGDITLAHLETFILEYRSSYPAPSGIIAMLTLPALRRFQIPEILFATKDDPVSFITTLVTRSGCDLRKLSIPDAQTTHVTAYHDAFPSISLVFSPLNIAEPLDFLINWEDKLEDAESSDSNDESEDHEDLGSKDEEEDIIPKVEIDPSTLMPLSPEVISKQVCSCAARHVDDHVQTQGRLQPCQKWGLKLLEESGATYFISGHIIHIRQVNLRDSLLVSENISHKGQANAVLKELPYDLADNPFTSPPPHASHTDVSSMQHSLTFLSHLTPLSVSPSLFFPCPSYSPPFPCITSGDVWSVARELDTL
ncbi:hypothetical protein B0H14DRAFT_3659099 [Mycena olivaceomarginata]|nr:hypothetical protein B0H14DRAFT_3659099 [Mycena olivaceomarginata]